MFAMTAALGGINVLAVRISVGELAPFWAAGLRFTLAAVIFIIITMALRVPWPGGRQLLLTIVNGLLGISLFYALAYWALVRVSAGTATVVLALVPLVTLLLATAQRFERISRKSVAGSLLAVIGIGWMVIGPGEVSSAVLPLLALLAATVCVGESVIVSKMISANHPAITNAVSLSVGALTLLGMSALTGEQWALPRQAEVVWSLVYLVTLGSVGVFALVLLVVRRLTASATAYMFVLFPLVAMVAGPWLVDEPVTAAGAVGAILVMIGVWLGALSPGSRRSSQVRAAERTAPVLESS
jgi:drug/metabolite transporter (DMT)-like permease